MATNEVWWEGQAWELGFGVAIDTDGTLCHVLSIHEKATERHLCFVVNVDKLAPKLLKCLNSPKELWGGETC